MRDPNLYQLYVESEQEAENFNNNDRRQVVREDISEIDEVYIEVKNVSH